MAGTKPKTRRDTYSRYLDAAERLFIERGYEGATIRTISKAADAPLGTLHHYWGNKEALFRDVCERRFGAIRAEQIRRLRVCRQRLAAGEALDVQQVLRSLIEPPLQVAGEPPRVRRVIRRLYGRAFTEPSAAVSRAVREMFAEATQLFLQSLRRCSPELDARQFYWRCTCVFGVLVFTQSFGDRLQAVLPAPPEKDWNAVVEEIVAFVTRGWQGPATARPRRRSVVQ